MRAPAVTLAGLMIADRSTCGTGNAVTALTTLASGCAAAGFATTCATELLLETVVRRCEHAS
jgi:hypothetical protein